MPSGPSGKLSSDAVADNANAHFEALGGNAGYMRPAAWTSPNGAKLWICSQYDISADFIRNCTTSFGLPLIITCKDDLVDEVWQTCQKQGTRNIQFNIGFAKERNRDWYTVLEEVQEQLNAGRDVVVHCRAGKHRAALAFVLLRCYLSGISFQESREALEAIRAVEISEVLIPRWAHGKWSEDYRKWLPDWEQDALSNKRWRVDPAPTSTAATGSAGSASRPPGSEEAAVQAKQIPVKKAQAVEIPSSSSASRSAKEDDWNVLALATQAAVEPPLLGRGGRGSLPMDAPAESKSSAEKPASSTLPWQTPPPDRIFGQARLISEVVEQCTPEMAWTKLHSFAALSSPTATLKLIPWTHVITQVWHMALRESGYKSGVAPPTDIDTWQDILLGTQLHTVEDLHQYVLDWAREDPLVQTWLTGSVSCRKATADIGGWLMDYVNTAFLRMTGQAKLRVHYRVVDNRLYHSLGQLIGNPDLGREKTGDAWEQLGWHAFEHDRGAFILAVIWNTSNRALSQHPANATDGHPKAPPPLFIHPLCGSAVEASGVAKPAFKAPPPLLTPSKAPPPLLTPSASALPGTAANAVEMHVATDGDAQDAVLTRPPAAFLFTKDDAAALRANHALRQGLHKALRGHLQEVAGASPKKPEHRIVEVPKSLPWREYIAFHHEHDRWIGPGIVRFHLYFMPDIDPQQMRQGQLRLNYVIHRADDSHTLLHPGTRPVNDAKPIYLSPGEFQNLHRRGGVTKPAR